MKIYNIYKTPLRGKRYQFAFVCDIHKRYLYLYSNPIDNLTRWKFCFSYVSWNFYYGNNLFNTTESSWLEVLVMSGYSKEQIEKELGKYMMPKGYK